jgi:hypothetical protein
MAFRNKADAILRHAPDLLIVPECEHPDKLQSTVNNLQSASTIWHGTNPHKGLGIFAFGGYKLELLPQHNPAYEIILPITVTKGRKRFFLLAIWANNPADKGYQYIGQVWKAIHAYKSLIGKTNTILAGDFNSNTIWDKPKRIHNHTALVDLLQQKGISSVYHHFHRQEQGKEKHPTQYMYRHRAKPYHLDYCFTSADLTACLKKVTVGRFSNWSAHSDHMPVIAEFNL